MPRSAMDCSPGRKGISPMSSETDVLRPGFVRLQGVVKDFRIYQKPIDRLREIMALGMKRWSTDYRALSGVGFTIEPGEAVGLIGPNGAGKSTLLQMVCGTTVPSAGTIETHGRIYALLQLGAGFHPDFTGRENIHLSGAILGMTRDEVEACMDDILAFADIGGFIEQPVRTYSSGMFVRLAFSVAVTTRPDILIVDEALSVGDAAFQRKCYHYIRGKLSGSTRIFVTHEMPTLAAMTDRVIVLRGGTVAFDGPTREGIKVHERFMREAPGRESFQSSAEGLPAGFDGVSPVSGRLLSDGNDASFLTPGLSVTAAVRVEASRAFRCCGTITVSDRRGLAVAGQSFGQEGGAVEVQAGQREIRIAFRWPAVQGGEYVVTAEIEDEGSEGSFSIDLASVTAGSDGRHPGLIAAEIERVTVH